MPAPRRLLLALVALLVLAACGSTDTVAATSAPLPEVFEEGVPDPAGDVLLTVDPLDGEPVDWDRAALELLPQRELTLFEPFIDEERTFTGPLWWDVLRASGVEPGRDVDLVALDDYTASLPADPEVLARTVLALTDQGAPIPIDAGGPVRLVYPDGDALADNPNNWIWSIRRAEAR